MIKNILPYIVIAFLIVLLFFKDCAGKTDKPQIIETPAVIAELPTQKPIQKPITEKQTTPTVIIVKNDSLLYEYQQENDSLKKLLLFKKAIQLNKFSSKFEDENLTLNIEGIVQGEVQEITPSYIIKPKSIEVKQKEVKFRLLAGIEVGNTLLFDKPLFKTNIGFQNAKGNIITASYDSEQRIFVGYNFTVFKIRR